MVEYVRIECGHLDPVLHVAVVNDLQDFLLLDGQFIGLRRLETRKHNRLAFCWREAEVKRWRRTRPFTPDDVKMVETRRLIRLCFKGSESSVSGFKMLLKTSLEFIFSVDYFVGFDVTIG